MALLIIKHLKKEAVSIKQTLHKRLAGWEEPRAHFPLRASDLLKKDSEFCPREHALLDMKVAVKKGSFVGTSLRMTFDHGKDTEERIRNKYLRDMAVGTWTCGVCDFPLPQFGKAPRCKCPTCGWENWRYDEPAFSSASTGIHGHIDILLDVGSTKLRLVELKTMAPDEFKTLVAPLAEHKARTSLYLSLASESSWEPSKRVNTEEATILYVSKAFGIKDDSLRAAGIKDAAFSPFKEFTIKRDDTLITTPLAKARVLKIWRDNPKVGLPCGVCVNGLSKRAQGCSVVSACWSGSYPSVLTWPVAGEARHPGKKVVV